MLLRIVDFPDPTRCNCDGNEGIVYRMFTHDGDRCLSNSGSILHHALERESLTIRHCGITMLHLKENIPLVVILNESVDVGRITVTLVFNSHAREADELFHPRWILNVILPHGYPPFCRHPPQRGMPLPFLSMEMTFAAKKSSATNWL